MSSYVDISDVDFWLFVRPYSLVMVEVGEDTQNHLAVPCCRIVDVSDHGVDSDGNARH